MLASDPCVTYNIKHQMFSSGGTYKGCGTHMNFKKTSELYQPS